MIRTDKLFTALFTNLLHAGSQYNRVGAVKLFCRFALMPSNRRRTRFLIHIASVCFALLFGQFQRMNLVVVFLGQQRKVDNIVVRAIMIYMMYHHSFGNLTVIMFPHGAVKVFPLVAIIPALRVIGIMLSVIVD
jgi:hypothetical protein